MTATSDWLDLLERLWRQPIKHSRNKNFDLYHSGEGKRALRGYRLLRSLRRDIRASAQVRVRRSANQAQIAISLEAIHGRRQVSLSTRMFELLLEDDELGERLRAALQASEDAEVSDAIS